MTGRILILGAAGRFGMAAAKAFHAAGWTVTSLVRPGVAQRAPPGTIVIEANALNAQAVTEAARDQDVVLHALNPPYNEWSKIALPLAYAAISAAETTGATLLFPGNVYNYGAGMPPVLDETTPMRPTSRKGQLRLTIEQRLQESAERGTRSIILRAGDFYGSGRGSWFDLVIAKNIRSGRITYPGPFDVIHEWAYLPDLATAMERLAAKRETLDMFSSFGFPGHAVTGEQLGGAIARALRRKFKVKRMSWWLIHALSPFMTLPREISEMAYLWEVPHRIAGAKLAAAIGAVPRTPLDPAVARTLRDLGVA